jgi:hypothetical protein
VIRSDGLWEYTQYFGQRESLLVNASYFAITGAHPILPFDIAEATYLQPPSFSVMSTTDLISRRAIALQKHSADVNQLYSKVYQARLKAA